MTIWILSLTHFLHLLGAIVWIGGIMMMICVILPGSKTALESGSAGKLMKEVAQRFTPLANLSIFVLILTGTVIILISENLRPVFGWGDIRTLAFSLKLLLVAGMIFIHLYRGLILNPRIAKSSALTSDIDLARMKKISLDLVRINLAGGIIVLTFAAVSLSL